jgi:hypothetical protein
LADVNAVIAVGGMAHDPFILFEERIHGRPGEGDLPFQHVRVDRQIGVLPRRSLYATFATPHRIPACRPEIAVPSGMLNRLQDIWTYVRFRKISHWISVGLEKQNDLLAIGDPRSAETYPHASTQRFRV